MTPAFVFPPRTRRATTAASSSIRTAARSCRRRGRPRAILETARPTNAEFDAWRPGLDSEIPRALARLATVFRPENALTGYDEVHELAHLTGLAVDELAIFRPERLAVHELLVRVTAELSVPDGPRQEDLGIEFRRMVQTILPRHIAPHMADIVAAYETLRRAL